MELFNEDIQKAGFRLQYLEVFNWGTFNQVRWSIHPNGDNALLTGDIGSGKSTLVDALTCLLVPHNKITFNKAAGAESRERNLLSYVKGEYKKEKHEITQTAKKIYLRPNDDTYTVIIGNFYNEGYQENVCLAQLFWVGKDNKVEKLLIISTKPLSLKEHFSNFADIGELKKKLRQTANIQLFNDNFSQYSEQFRRQFGMNSEKAIDLFYQTVSMKSVSSLTDFVREQMLEKTDVKDQIATLLKRFDDLNKAHTAVVNAREQYQILKPLVENAIEFSKVIAEIENLEAMLEVMPGWFAAKKITLLETAIKKAIEETEKEQRQLELLLTEEDTLEGKKQTLSQDIANNGGNRLEQIAGEIKRNNDDVTNKKKEYDEYNQFSTLCGLPTVKNEQEFEQNTQKARLLEISCVEQEQALRNTRDDLVSEHRKLQTEYNLEQEELNSLKERQTQIPSYLIGFRTQLCDDLRIAETELPFIGELLKVNEAATEWEGAIEKLLRDAGISLVVPTHHYRSVSKYVNDNPLRRPDGKGMKLTYLEANLKSIPRNNKELTDDSIIYKIDIKPDTDFYDWIEQYLQYSFGDYQCVDVEGLQHTSFGITRQGLIKSGRIRHTKDDRHQLNDRRNYVLGWSNLEKLKALEAAVENLEIKMNDLSKKVRQVEQEENENQKLKEAIIRLLSRNDYARINWQYHATKIAELEKEKYEILNNNDKLQFLQQERQEVERKLREIRLQQTDINKSIGSKEKDIINYQDQHADASHLLSQITELNQQRWFPFIEEKMQGKTLLLKGIDNRMEEFRKFYISDQGELKRLRSKQGGLRSAIETKMRDIKEHSKAEYSELPLNIEARAEYMAKFEQLQREDLKRHEERFKNELNKNTINSIAVFDSQLEKHEIEIKQKIKLINQHLHEIVYNASQDTFITILIDASSNKDIRQFREDLRACYRQSLSSNAELYTEEKYEQVKRILDRFASMENSNKEWTSTVTDVRNWYEFNASERFRADNSEKEFYEGSGGKSGGQKEKLAYTILASALAYQFGLQFGESKSRSFRFVVIDEAFGRGSDESTRYGMELFKKLNLQLLIVTPLQKIHVIESHVNSFHFVSNREGNNSQVSNLTKEEYESEKLKHNLVYLQKN
jgi:uncharacterized protein YPO0396